MILNPSFPLFASVQIFTIAVQQFSPNCDLNCSDKFSAADRHEFHAGDHLDFARQLGGGTQNRQTTPDFQFAGDDLCDWLKQWCDGFGDWKFGRHMERN